MVEYLRSVWHADLNFYSRALSSTALRVRCSLKCLPGYPTFLCQAMWLCWSFFSSLKPVWGVECWRGFDLQVLCCGTLSAFVCLSQTVLQWWHLVMTSSQASHNMKSWQKYDRNYALVLALFFFFECEFLTSFVPLLQDILGLTPAFSSGHANILVTIYLIEGFQKHSLLVRSQISGVTPESGLETQIPSAGL